MKIADTIDQLKSLKAHCKRMINPDDDIWDKDVEALDAAILSLKLMEGRGYETVGDNHADQSHSGRSEPGAHSAV